jgi:putative SOS response-associated peptidase YedK
MDAFYNRRGFTWAHGFNLAKEVPVFDDEGNITLKTWTQQWTIKPKDGKPIILAVIYDEFDVGKGPEFEFAQLTMPTNKILSSITDRMPVILRPEDLELWLGEVRAPMSEVKELIKTVEFNDDEWEIGPEDPTKKPPRPRARKKTVNEKPRLF